MIEGGPTSAVNPIGANYDGVGGVRADGSGLTGLADRLAALDGELRVESPADGGHPPCGRHPPPWLAFEAFAATFWWVLAFSALALIPPLCYRGARRRSARREHAPTAGIGTSMD